MILNINKIFLDVIVVLGKCSVDNFFTNTFYKSHIVAVNVVC